MSVYTLTDSGTQALSADVTAIYVAITVVPPTSGVGTAEPTNRYHVALLRFGDGTGFWAALPVTGGPDWIGLPVGTTEIGYSVASGGEIEITEVTGGTSPFGPSDLSSLSDVDLTSLADTQILAWDATSGKWVNIDQPSGGGASLAYHDEHLSSDVVMTSAATDYDVLTRSLPAGTWLLLAEVEAYNSGGSANHSVNAKLWDGSTIYKVGVGSQTGNFFLVPITIFAVVVLASTTTVKLTCRDNDVGDTHIGAANLGSPFSAPDTHLVTIQLA